MQPEFDRASALASRLVWRSESPSTNAELVDLARNRPQEWPHFAVLATDRQTAGRGRRDRGWESPAGASLAISVLLRPTVPVETLGWVPLIAGLAMARAVRETLETAGLDGSGVSVKWPNDVLVGQRKICGVLAELSVTDAGVALVVGAGVNTVMTADQLPVSTATSLAVEGVPNPQPDDVLAAYLSHLRRLYGAFDASDGDADAAGIREAVIEMCSTVGAHVSVQLPEEQALRGTAVSIDSSGHLVVSPDGGGLDVSVAAGDVVHVRRDSRLA